MNKNAKHVTPVSRVSETFGRGKLTAHDCYRATVMNKLPVDFGDEKENQDK